MSVAFTSAFVYGVIYIMSIPDNKHKDLLKIGYTTLDTNKNIDQLPPCSSELQKAANSRIKEYTNTAGIDYKLLHTELAVMQEAQNGHFIQRLFSDKDVHRVLENSGVKRKKFADSTGREWFDVDLNTAIKAISAVKEGRTNLTGTKNKKEFSPLVLRPEQSEAVEKTIKCFEKNRSMLWNAKMRFGKTVTALYLIKKMGFEKSIIVTHRPVVDQGWRDDFDNIFCSEDDCIYLSKKDFDNKEFKLPQNKKFIFFASIQDLRGSSYIDGKFDKNTDIFKTIWDLVIVDEAHEGTTTALGNDVISALVKEKSCPNTKFLALSGTPFNIMSQYDHNSTYTWDYTMEQQAKEKWDYDHFGTANPYVDLPKLNIYTYDLGKILKSSAYIEIVDKAFNFTEFFKVKIKGAINDSVTPRIGDDLEFVYKNDVKNFLDLLTTSDEDSMYPFSSEENRQLFKHTLWMVPGVKEAKALEDLLNNHPVFGSTFFKIINVAGNEGTKDPLGSVNQAISLAGEDGYTITLSCGKLTTGVTVPEWTGVLMLSGSYATSASSYLQTIFRVQSPCKKSGKIKANCYVFDFAPDRALKIISEAVDVSNKPGKTKEDNRIKLDNFLNFCPVISINGTEMKKYNTDKLLQHLKRAYADRAIRSGFDDTSIYSDELFKLTPDGFSKFKNLKSIIGTTAASHKTKDIDINAQGFTGEEYENIEKLKKKNKKELTEEEREELKRLKELRENRASAISILRGISVRMPLLIYGADIKLEDDFKIEDFLNENIIDHDSWEEFMPKGVTKRIFKDFIKYYDKDVFIAASRKIRHIAKYADSLPPKERIQHIAELFSYFKNPDKETVLTPWRVVNLHLSKALGGYCFYDISFEELIDEPRFVDNPRLTSKTLGSSSSILEINSKTGLYPLYTAYSIFRQKLIKVVESCDKPITNEELKDLWNQTITDNIYIICKTEMAKKITKRTLLGYQDVKINAHYFKDLVNALKNGKTKTVIDKILSTKYWNKGQKDKMKFDAVVGNPPYQENIKNRGEQPPIYHLFYDLAEQLSDIVTLITPARFLFDAGKTPSDWNKKMLDSKHFSVVQYFSNSNDVFNNVSIKGGVCISIIDKHHEYDPIINYIPDEPLKKINEKVKSQCNSFMSSIVFTNTSYKFSPLFFQENPELKSRVQGGSLQYLASPAFSKFPEVFFDTKPSDQDDYALIYGRINNTRAKMFYKTKYLNPPSNYAKYKVIIAASNGTGALGETLSSPFVGLPYEGHTETFMTLGCFDTYQEAENLLKYIKTKFFRMLLGVKKVTQGNKKSEVWSCIPMQDFTNNSDIDWSLSVQQIDDILYKKYNLDDDEIVFINETAKEMS